MEKNSADSAVRKKRRILAAFLLLAATMAAGILLNIWLYSCRISGPFAVSRHRPRGVMRSAGMTGSAKNDNVMNGSISAGTPISCAFFIIRPKVSLTDSNPASLISPMIGSGSVSNTSPFSTTV